MTHLDLCLSQSNKKINVLIGADLNWQFHTGCVERINKNLFCVETLYDSTVVGYAKQRKPFVSNRVHEIQDLTNSQNWRFEKGEQNPADIVSRAEESLKNGRLWHGPRWLTENWPTNEGLFQETTNEERIIRVNSRMKNQSRISITSVPCQRYSELRHGFINNMKLMKINRIKTPPLPAEEIEEA
ncbi:hypothetical protein TNCV_4355281 [Trichonephila clavipes]|nr:hypothetical protein TNCV_4355281 [Trichonephila clavipes]